jgi:hypothetical protein
MHTVYVRWCSLNQLSGLRVRSLSRFLAAAFFVLSQSLLAPEPRGTRRRDTRVFSCLRPPTIHDTKLSLDSECLVFCGRQPHTAGPRSLGPLSSDSLRGGAVFRASRAHLCKTRLKQRTLASGAARSGWLPPAAHPRGRRAAAQFGRRLVRGSGRVAHAI